MSITCNECHDTRLYVNDFRRRQHAAAKKPAENTTRSLFAILLCSYIPVMWVSVLYRTFATTTLIPAIGLVVGVIAAYVLWRIDKTTVRQAEPIRHFLDDVKMQWHHHRASIDELTAISADTFSVWSGKQGNWGKTTHVFVTHPDRARCQVLTAPGRGSQFDFTCYENERAELYLRYTAGTNCSVKLGSDEMYVELVKLLKRRGGSFGRTEHFHSLFGAMTTSLGWSERTSRRMQALLAMTRKGEFQKTLGRTKYHAFFVALFAEWLRDGQWPDADTPLGFAEERDKILKRLEDFRSVPPQPGSPEDSQPPNA